MDNVIFWDFDGTLVYSNSSFQDSLNLALEAYHYKIAIESIAAFLKGASSWYSPQTAYPEATGEQWWETLLEKVAFFCESNHVCPSDIPQICRSFRQNVIDFEYLLYDDAEDILSYCLEKGYQNYIISNNFPELIDVISKYHLQHYFSGCILSANIGYEKPRLELFQAAMKMAGNPPLCYMIGDNPIADMEGGRNAGMKTILVHNNNGAKLPDTLICKELKDIKKFI